MESGGLTIFCDFLIVKLAYSVACVLIREKVSLGMRADGNKYQGRYKMPEVKSRIHCGKKETGTWKSFPLVGEASIPRGQYGNMKKEPGNV